MKKLLAVLLAITIVMSMGVVAFAAHDGGTHGTDSEAAVGEQKELATSGGSQFGKTDFYLNIHKNAVSGDTQISATIPLWVCMYAYGGDGMVVTPADAYKILNTGTDTDIKVYAMRALPQEGWTFNTFDSSVYSGGGYVRANNTLTAAKTMAMTVNGVDLSTISDSENTDLAAPWKVVKNNGTTDGELKLPLQAYIAPGGVNEGDDTNVVNVLYFVTAA